MMTLARRLRCIGSLSAALLFAMAPPLAAQAQERPDAAPQPGASPSSAQPTVESQSAPTQPAPQPDASPTAQPAPAQPAPTQPAPVVVQTTTYQASGSPEVITIVEPTPPTKWERQPIDAGFILRPGMHIPLGGHHRSSLYGEVGFSLDLGLAIQAQYFSIELRSGVRAGRIGTGNSDRGSAGSYGTIPFDLGVFFLPFDGVISPVIGAGFGGRWLWDNPNFEASSGEVLVIESRNDGFARGLGVGTFARAGLMFFRQSRVQLTLLADYDVSFVKLRGDSVHHALNITIGTIF